MKDKNINLGHLFIQDLISILFPFSFLSTLHSFLCEAFVSIPRLSIVFCIGSLFSLLFSTVVYKIVDGEFGRTVSKTRALFLLVFVLYVILIFFNKKTFPDRIVLSGKLFYILIFQFFSWFLNFYCESCFSTWNKFLSASRNKTGNDLYVSLREDDLMMERASEAMKKVNLLTKWLVFLNFFIIVISWINKYQFSIRSTLFFASLLVIALGINTYVLCSENELSFASIGITSIFSLTYKRVIAALCMILICVTFSFILSPGKQILNAKNNFSLDDSLLVKVISVFANLFHDNDELFTRMNEETPDELIQSVTVNDSKQLTENSLQAINTDTVDRLDSIIENVFKIIVIGIIILFMVLPLFNKKFRNFFKEKKIQKFFKNAIYKIILFIKSLKTKTLKENQISITNKKLYEEYVNKIDKKVISKKKKQEIGEMSKLFFMIVEVGKKKNIDLTLSMTPSEYINKLIKVFVEEEKNLILISKLFEKCLYSDIELTDEEKKEYKDCYNKFIGSTSTSM